MNTGIVFSGGGLRGIAHIGTLKALEEFNIAPTHVSGTSVGAIVGALYAAGYSWEEMLGFFKEVQLFSLEKYAWRKPGFIDTEKFYPVLKEYFPTNSFSDLELPLYTTATNVLDGTLKIFNQGPLIPALLASAAFPGVFTPVKIEDAFYIDGGTLDNFPVNLVQPHVEKIIGVYVNPFDKILARELNHSYVVMERAYRIKMAHDSLAKFDQFDVLIYPKELNNFKMFSTKNVERIFELGYESAIQALSEGT